MRPSVALNANRDAVRRATSKFPVTNLRVFGSVIHGMDKEGSDIDFLVNPLPGATLFDLGGLQQELEAILAVKVDLLTPADLPINFRQRVVSAAQAV